MSALREFVADLLDSEGALVEPVEPDSLDVLAPEPLRAAMSWPELARLAFGAQRPPGAMAVGLEATGSTSSGHCSAAAAASPSASSCLRSLQRRRATRSADWSRRS